MDFYPRIDDLDKVSAQLGLLRQEIAQGAAAAAAGSPGARANRCCGRRLRLSFALSLL